MIEVLTIINIILFIVIIIFQEVHFYFLILIIILSLILNFPYFTCLSFLKFFLLVNFVKWLSLFIHFLICLNIICFVIAIIVYLKLIQ